MLNLENKAMMIIKKDNFIHQYCDNCDNDVIMQWDTSVHGFVAYCHFCGERLFLCDACEHNRNHDNDCDWKCDYNGNQDCMFTRIF